MALVNEGRRKQGQLPITRQATAAGNTVVIAAPGAGRQLIIHRGVIVNRANAVSPIFGLRAGPNPLLFVGRVPANGSVAFDFGEIGWALRPGLGLDVNLAVAGDIQVNITTYRIENV